MCGISGVLLLSLSASAPPDWSIQQALSALSHRGPDHEGGIQILPHGSFLAYTRLIIVDKSNDKTAGHQPFVSPDRCNALVCNGEIYNYSSLCPIDDPEPASDTAALLPFWERCKGNVAEFSESLRGQFAICIVECTHGSISAVHLIRDPMGIKPLFYNYSGGCLSFASELKGLPKACASESTKELPPGHYLTFRVNSDGTNQEIPSPQRYFSAHWLEAPQKSPLPLLDPNLDGIYTGIHEALSDSVKKRLMADVPVCILLSGGIDSSLIAALAARHYPHIHTYTIQIGTEDAESRDAQHATQVAEHIGSHHHLIRVSYEEAFDALPAVVHALETYDVISVRAAVPLYLLCQYLRKETPHRVVMVGEGADELFAGYSLYADHPTLEAEVRRRLAYIGDSELLRVDRVTMASGIEARVPFLGIDLLCVAMHKGCSALKLWSPHLGLIEKLLLRDAFNRKDPDLLPETILYRKKEQFADGVGRGWIPYLLGRVGGRDGEEEYYKSLLGVHNSRVELMVHAAEQRSERRRKAYTHFQSERAQGYVSGSTHIRSHLMLDSDPDMGTLISTAEAEEFLTQRLHLDLSRRRMPSLSALNDMIAATLRHIPWHNLTLLTRERRPPTNAEIKEDFLTGLGGPCAVVNAAFGALLHTLGYQVAYCPTTITVSEFDKGHVGIIVWLQGRAYFVDVANAKPYVEAMSIHDAATCKGGVVVRSEPFACRLRYNEDVRVMELHHGYTDGTNGLKWDEYRALHFDPAELWHYAQFRPMIQASRSRGEFLKRYRLISYGTGSTARCIRGDHGKGCVVRHGAEKEWTNVDREEDLVSIIYEWFPETVAELAREALDVLRREDVKLFEIQD